MIRTIVIIVGICTLIGFPFGCSDPDLSTHKNVVEGLPATVSMVFEKSKPAEIKSRATNTVDNEMEHVYILIFDAGAGQPLKTLYRSTYSGGTLLIPTRSGSSIIYAVANIGQNPLIADGNTLFDDVASLSGFQQKMAEIGLTGPMTGQVLPMSGRTTGSVDIQPGENPTNISIPVQRLTAKISLQVLTQLPATDKISLLSWQVVNVPAYSYIDQASHDAVTDRTETAGDSNYFSSPAQAFTPVVLTPGPGTVMVPGAGFYQFENRKGNIGTINDQVQRAAKAPARATYINVKARYQNATEVKDVTYHVHLGINDKTNYDVSRNTHHIYTMTIQGLTQYSTNVVVTDQDSRVVLGDTIFAVDLFEPVLDAHYDWRPIRIRAVPGYSRVEIIDDMGNPADANSSWLKLSLNPTWPTMAELSANPNLAPTTEFTELQHVAGTPSKTVYLYADEMFTNDVPITTIRTFNLRFTFTPSTDPANLNVPDSCYTVIRAIEQKPPLAMGSMGIRRNDESGNVIPGDGDVFAIERRDEFTMKLGATGLAATPIEGIRWGFNGRIMQPINPIAFEYYRTNGMNNTIKMVYTTGGSYFDQTSTTDLGTPAYTGIFDPIYNTYAARYAIQKNRDLDGNGKIDGEEIKWYFPSRAELLLMWVGKRGSSATADEKMVASYWGSSESGNWQAINVNFFNGGTGGDFSKNTTDYVRAVRKMADPNPGSLKSPYVVNGTRQITGLPSGVSAGAPAHVKGQPFPLHGAEDALNTVAPTFEVARQDCGPDGTAIVLPGTSTMEWYKAAGWTAAWQTPPPVVASPATGCNAYWEGSVNDPVKGAGMWRMPTQRELLIIWILRKELLYDGFTLLGTGRYWSAPNYYDQSWFTDFSSGYTGVPNLTPGNPPFQYSVRCVRDVTTPARRHVR